MRMELINKINTTIEVESKNKYKKIYRDLQNRDIKRNQRHELCLFFFVNYTITHIHFICSFNCVCYCYSEQSPFYLMLLSSKAGGVGLTLTGGSRLILLEVRCTSYGVDYTVQNVRYRLYCIEHTVYIIYCSMQYILKVNTTQYVF